MKKKVCNQKLGTTCGGIEGADIHLEPPHGKGLYLANCYNLKTRKSTYPALIYQFGRKKEDYIWVNRCPFCGTRLHG